MYLLDITNTYYTSEKVTEEQYKKLENVSQSEMKYIENNQYKWLGHKKAVVKDCFF